MFSFDLQVRFADAERTKRIVALWYTKYWYFLDMNYISIGFVEMFNAKLSLRIIFDWSVVLEPVGNNFGVNSNGKFTIYTIFSKSQLPTPSRSSIV